MHWWLIVLLLLNGSQIHGAQFDLWPSRSFPELSKCEQRRQFGDDHSEGTRLGFSMAQDWGNCRRGTRSLATISSLAETMSLSALVHWYEPPNPLGLEVFTSEKLKWMAEDVIGLRYTGPLREPLATQLREILFKAPQKYNRVILELDSDGGELNYVEELVSVLKDVREHAELTTRVTEGSLCASGCIPLFVQGTRRLASGSSIWVFHGARGTFINLPNPAATDKYLDILSAAGMTAEFRTMLETDNRIYRPGSFIFSGYELFAVLKAGIVTELLPTWREEAPIAPSGIGPH